MKHYRARTKMLTKKKNDKKNLMSQYNEVNMKFNALGLMASSMVLGPILSNHNYSPRDAEARDYSQLKRELIKSCCQ